MYAHWKAWTVLFDYTNLSTFSNMGNAGKDYNGNIKYYDFCKGKHASSAGTVNAKLNTGIYINNPYNDMRTYVGTQVPVNTNNYSEIRIVLDSNPKASYEYNTITLNFIDTNSYIENDWNNFGSFQDFIRLASGTTYTNHSTYFNINNEGNKYLRFGFAHTGDVTIKKIYLVP